MLLDKLALKSLAKNVHGFLPIKKPRGVCSTALCHFVICDLNWTMARAGFGYIYINGTTVRYLEPFAEGLVTLSIGTGDYRKRNFAHAEYRYNCTVEFGVQRLNNSIDGHILNHKPIDHLSYDIIDDQAQMFVGTQLQLSPKSTYYRVTNETCYENTGTSQYYRKMKPFNYGYWQFEKELIKQKYPIASQMRDVQCDSIKLIDLVGAKARFDIKCNGNFLIRQFIKDLATKLGTAASIVEMTRVREGPIHLDDMRVLEFHQTICDYYLPRLTALENVYSPYLRQFDHLFETKKVRRN